MKRILVVLAPAILFLAFQTAHVLAVSYPTNYGRTFPTGFSPGLGAGVVSTPIVPTNTGTGSATGRLRACQARENAIKTRSANLVRLVGVMERTFDAIASRVETFYTTKVVPAGHTVANYSALVADIQLKKAAVETALVSAQSDVAGFSCTGSDPKTQLTQFQKDMQLVKNALKDYRTSIKNLIVAVRSVVGEENKTATPSGNTGGNK